MSMLRTGSAALLAAFAVAACGGVHAVNDNADSGDCGGTVVKCYAQGAALWCASASALYGGPTAAILSHEPGFADGGQVFVPCPNATAAGDNSYILLDAADVGADGMPIGCPPSLLLNSPVVSLPVALDGGGVDAATQIGNACCYPVTQPFCS